jgi:predicted DNA-binding transcriptional regulator AlpA
VKEVARLLCLGERTVWRLSGGGMLPKPISIGRSRRWHRKVIEAFVIGKGQENPKK